jgi:hypothetical protein
VCDRQGLLQGKRLSKAQRLAVELLVVEESRLKSKEMGDRLRLALVTADPDRFLRPMFPEAFVDEAGITSDVPLDQEGNIDSEDVIFDFSKSEITNPEEAEELIRTLFADTGVLTPASENPWS